MRKDDISVHVETIILPKVSAKRLLANPKTACFAAGANAGTWSDMELCARVAAALATNATWAERHMAVVAAAMHKRYDAMVSAMEQVNLEPVIIEDLVKFGEDRGFDRGTNQVYVRHFARRLGRALTPTECETLTQRLSTLGVDRVDDVLFAWEAAALERWLADPAAQ